MLKSLVHASAVALVVVLAGCADLPNLQPPFKPGETLSSDEVLIVGQIDIAPALRENEQYLTHYVVARDYRNRAVIYLNDVPKPAEKNGLAINPELNKVFWSRIPRSTRFIAGAYVQLEWWYDGRGTMNDRKLWIRLVAPLDIKSDDAAIYIGRFRIQRDEFGEVTDLKVVDDYANASAEFARNVGKGTKLRKAVIKLMQ